MGAAPPRRGACSQQALALLVSQKETDEEGKGPGLQRGAGGIEAVLLRVLTCSACRHHPSAASSHRRSVVLGARMGLGPSAREGLSPILVPNTLRHFSIQK